MRTPILIMISLVIVLGLLGYMMTYTVRFNEKAVVTSFGKASENSVVDTSGLGFKLPPPLQSVTKYDIRPRLLKTKIETQQTSDDRQIVVEAFLAWRVDDPLVFFKSFRGDAQGDVQAQYRKAEKQLIPLLRSAMAEVSGYTLKELFAPAGQSRLPELEQRVKARLTGENSAETSPLTTLGIDVALIGISKIELPESATKQVFNRMIANRDKIAAATSSEGNSEASTIAARTARDAETIRNFAESIAADLIRQGEVEAAVYAKAQEKNPQLATFLRSIEVLERGFADKVTLILDTTTPGMEFFDPKWLNALIGEGEERSSGRGGR